MRTRRHILVLALVSFAACQAQAPSGSGNETSPTPGATPTSSTSVAAPTGSPAITPVQSGAAVQTEAPEPTGATSGVRPLVVDGLAEVVTDDLRMRTEAGVQASSRRLSPLLQRGTLAFVLEGPRAASGYDWYRIVPVGGTGDLPGVGWVALAGKDGEQWIEPYDGCPAPPNDTFPAMTGLAALGCFGGETLTIRARLGTWETGRCFEYEPPFHTLPLWLDDCNQTTYIFDPASELTWETTWDSAYIAHPPGVPEAEFGPVESWPGSWRVATITGQYDHPAARTCRASVNPDPEFPEDVTEPDPALVILACRASFAVKSIVYREG